jgi:putative transcriptional regulator
MKNLIKVERAKKDITQAELAEELKVSRQTINSVELGKFIPSTILSLKIAGFFKVKFEELFILEDEDWD